jgi:YHS domain-containing protein
VSVDYKLVLGAIGLAIFAGMFWITFRRGATDPVCGMTVDRSTAPTLVRGGRTFYFCSEHCRQAFTARRQRDQELDPAGTFGSGTIRI